MILEKFGWTYDYLLWGISWLNVSLMLSDALRPVDDGEESGTRNIKLETAEDIKQFVDHLNNG